MYLQTELVLRADRPGGYVEEPVAFLLHVLHGGHCSSHYVPVGSATGRLGAF
jgi:hypothetical protein